jgi:hypothetical protein
MTNLKIHGQGGPLWWIDNAGGKPWSTLAHYGFALVGPTTLNWQALAVGSYALSDPFPIAPGQTLAVGAGIATAHNMINGYYDVGFGLLVQGANVITVLFALRPDGSNEVGGGPGPNVFFASPSPGVVFKPQQPQSTYAPYVLGGVNYSDTANVGEGDVSTQFTVTCQPAAGDYQLLFGAFSVDGTVNQARPAALVIQGFAVI